MAAIHPFNRNTSFSPEAIEAMSGAFEKAMAFRSDRGAEDREALAMRIISAASMGERDPDKLAAFALASYSAGKNDAK